MLLQKLVNNSIFRGDGSSVTTNFIRDAFSCGANGDLITKFIRMLNVSLEDRERDGRVTLRQISARKVVRIGIVSSDSLVLVALSLPVLPHVL
jgi:hypothetical protein